MARKACDDLLVVAHSMGNVLAAHVALKFGDIHGIAMLAPVIDV